MSEFVTDFRISLQNPLCLSLDTGNETKGIMLARTAGPLVGMVKIGPIPYLAFGPRLLDVAGTLGIPLFLDLKWHDIPNTIQKVIEHLPSSIRMVTIHASGGPSMIAAARNACESRGPARPLLIAVTALTHLTPGEVSLIGFKSRWDMVKKLGTMALDAGADGLVLSPEELRLARGLWQNRPFLVTPGIRFGNDAIPLDDQHFSGTPTEALGNGSDLLVVGRPILLATDPVEAVRTILSTF